MIGRLVVTARPGERLDGPAARRSTNSARWWRRPSSSRSPPALGVAPPARGRPRRGAPGPAPRAPRRPRPGPGRDQPGPAGRPQPAGHRPGARRGLLDRISAELDGGSRRCGAWPGACCPRRWASWGWNRRSASWPSATRSPGSTCAWRWRPTPWPRCRPRSPTASTRSSRRPCATCTATPVPRRATCASPSTCPPLGSRRRPRPGREATWRALAWPWPTRRPGWW